MGIRWVGSVVYRNFIRSACLCFLFNLLLSQMCDFAPMTFTVPLWGSEVANSKTEILFTNTAGEVGMQCHILRICDVTTIEREGDFTWLGIYMLLSFVKVVSRGHAMSPLLNARVTLLR